MDQTAALIFMMLCIFAPMLLSFFESCNTVVVKEEVIKYKYITKKTKPVKISKPKEVDNKLFEDCLECLVSLGMKKVNAKKRVTDLFNKKDYVSIEDFLIDAYKIV